MLVHLYPGLFSVLSSGEAVAWLLLASWAFLLTTGGCSRCLSATAGFCWSGWFALLVVAFASFVVLGVKHCGTAPVPSFPGGRHLAVQRENEQR